MDEEKCLQGGLTTFPLSSSLSISSSSSTSSPASTSTPSTPSTPCTPCTPGPCSRPLPLPPSSLISFHSEAESILGCSHYRRSCQIRAPCCPPSTFHPCRFCHDEAVQEHKIDRHAIAEMVCMKCAQRGSARAQPVAATCADCAATMAAWYCLSDDMEVLTDRGFLSRAAVFAHVVFMTDVSPPPPPLLFASFDPSTGALEYRPATRLYRGLASALVEFTSETEAPHWASDADEYGLTPAEVQRMQAQSDRFRDGLRLQEEDNFRPEFHSTGVSLLVDPQHDMYVRVGMRGFAADRTTRWQSDQFSKIRADSLLSADVGEQRQQHVQMLGKAQAGLAPTAEAGELPFAPVLGLKDEAEVTAFLELYGYWLGDGYLQVERREGRSQRGYVCFSPKKDVDKTWLKTRLDVLGLTRESGHLYASGVDAANGQRDFLVKEPEWVDYFVGEYGPKYGVASITSSRPHTHTGLTVPLPKSVKWFWRWVWRLRKERARLVLAGLQLADGKEAGDENCICTSGVEFRDDVIRLALHAGYSARFRLSYKKGDHRGPGITAQHDIWSVWYSDSHTSAQPVLQNCKDIRRRDVPVAMEVWCPTVPPHGLIIARRVRQNADGVVTQASRPIVVGNCSVCKFFDDAPSRPIFHCADCGICRRGSREEFYHCHRCNCCYSQSMKDQHKCIENVLSSDCPICLENLFTSTLPVNFLPCGHALHGQLQRSHAHHRAEEARETIAASVLASILSPYPSFRCALPSVVCLENLFANPDLGVPYRCPSCKKSICDNAPRDLAIDEYLRQSPMPEEFSLWRAVILCNDCVCQSEVAYHFAFHRCPRRGCGSYNTDILRVLQIAPGSEEDTRRRREEEEARQRQPAPAAENEVDESKELDEADYVFLDPAISLQMEDPFDEEEEGEEGEGEIEGEEGEGEGEGGRSHQDDVDDAAAEAEYDEE